MAVYQQWIKQMYIDFDQAGTKDRYKLLVATITPRPIAWVVSQSSSGQLNAAPFSFFNAFSADPPVIGIGMGSHRPGRSKDSRINIQDSGQFVVNLVSETNAAAMNITAIDFDYGVDELQEAGLTTLPSVRISPPRIAESPVAFECQLRQIIELGSTSSLVLGQVVAMHVRDELMMDVQKLYVDTPNLKLIGRMHGTGWYTRTSDLFQLDRIPVDEWNHRHGR